MMLNYGGLLDSTRNGLGQDVEATFLSHKCLYTKINIFLSERKITF